MKCKSGYTKNRIGLTLSFWLSASSQVHLAPRRRRLQILRVDTDPILNQLLKRLDVLLRVDPRQQLAARLREIIEGLGLLRVEIDGVDVPLARVRGIDLRPRMRRDILAAAV